MGADAQARRIVVRGTIIGRDQPSDVLLEKGRVVAVRPPDRNRPDIGSSISIIAPTLFDIQVNGYAGLDLQSPSLQPEHVVQISMHLARLGVSHWVPTLITAPLRVLERNCRVIAEVMSDRRLARGIPGIHLEGPYISPLDGPRGAHAREHVRNPNIREFERLLRAADGRILYTTVAPELRQAIPYIKAVVRLGVVVSLGHHNASADVIARAVDAGARLCTHLGNGLSAQISRHHNPLWPQLADDRLTCSFIADLHHLPPEALKTFLRVKGPARTILTSDVTHLAGRKPGRYDLAGMPVDLLPSGRICLSGTELLAGSATPLLETVFNAARTTDFSLEQAFASASAIPARFFGIRGPFGSPQAGRKANFVVFERQGKGRQGAPRIQAVYVSGALIQSA